MATLLPKIAEPLAEESARIINPLSLAFVGDAVQTLFVRTALSLENEKQPQEALKTFVSAKAQARSAELLTPLLTEVETDMYKRGRNAKSKNRAPSASAVEYRVATGLESLIGYLYLSGQAPRLAELLTIAYKDLRKDQTKELI